MTVGAIERGSLPVVDLGAAMEAVSTRVGADLDVPGLPPFRMAVDPSFARSDAPGPGTAEDAVVVIGGRTFGAGLERGVEAACAATMGALQDEAIDHLGRAWPDVLDAGGQGLGVLDVGVDADGIAVWRLGDEVVCAVGHLRSACGAAGWRLG